MFRALIIDDEKKARDGLKILLGKDRDIVIDGECNNGLDAINLIPQKKPDLIFLDIQMPEVNGFDVLNSINYQVPAVIFTTAHNHYALKAFEIHAIDYLLKPYTDERFFESLNFAKNYLLSKGSSPLTYKINAVLQEYIKDHKLQENSFLVHQSSLKLPLNKFPVRVNGKIVFVEIAEIRFIESLDTYVKIHTKNTFVLLKESMREMEKRLASAGFVRIHRSYLINSKWLVEVEPYFNGDFFVKLTDGSKLKGSRNYRGFLKDYS